MVDLVAQILALVPPWTRVYRVQRDIPMPLVTSGVENGNLRELALARMKEKIKKKIIQIVRNHTFLHFFYFFPRNLEQVVETSGREKLEFKKFIIKESNQII